MMNEIIIFVTVRTASSRLPNKALLPINGVPMIMLLVKRISTTKNLKKILVCTTTEKSDDQLTKYLSSEKVSVFRGDNKDILSRLCDAAIQYDVEKFVVVEGDDLFCDIKLIEKTWELLSTSNYDFISWTNLPLGSSPLGIKTDKLRTLIEKKKSSDTETGWGKFILDSGLFNNLISSHPNKKFHRPDIRLTVDYPEDYEFSKKLYEKLSNTFSLIDIIKILDKNPDLLKINESVKEKYVHNFKEKMINERISDDT